MSTFIPENHHQLKGIKKKKVKRRKEFYTIIQKTRLENHTSFQAVWPQNTQLFLPPHRTITFEKALGSWKSTDKGSLTNITTTIRNECAMSDITPSTLLFLHIGHCYISLLLSPQISTRFCSTHASLSTSHLLSAFTKTSEETRRVFAFPVMPTHLPESCPCTPPLSY